MKHSNGDADWARHDCGTNDVTTAGTSNRPTILQIIPRLDTGGAELATLELTEAVVRAGGRMLVVTEGGRMAPRIAELGGTWIPFPAATKNPARMLGNAFRLTAIMRRERVDLIHARSRAPAWSALAAARLARRPIVSTYHGAYGGEAGVKNFYNSVMARGDIVIANSGFTARLIAQRHGKTAPRVRIVNRGVDLARFDPALLSPDRFDFMRKAWGITPSTRVILLAARLTDWKGQHVLIDAVARLKDGGRLMQQGAPDVAIILAGDAQGRDGYAGSLRSRAGAAGLGDVVRLVGHCDDMAAAFALAHVTIVASTKPEAFGRSATEAQAMGSPVIATDLGAPPETVLAEPRVAEAAITGWIVPPGDAGALASRIADALALDQAARSAMARRARAHVTANFSLERMKRQTLEIYDELLSARPGAAPGIALAPNFSAALLANAPKQQV